MQTTHTPRRTTALAIAAMLLSGIGIPAAYSAGTFPPLNAPATNETHPGKFVWAELFTSDSAAATTFYTGVLGWTSSTVVQSGETYTVFSLGTHPVAGLRQRAPTVAKHRSRWINYISVTDVAATEAKVVKAGGE